MACDETHLRRLEEVFDDIHDFTATPTRPSMREAEAAVGLQLLASSVPLLIAEIRRLRGVAEPPEPVPFPVDRSRR